MMKGGLFNYCLSGKRRVSKNASGIRINKFKIFVNRASLTPDKSSAFLMATLAFHSLLRLISRDSIRFRIPWGIL